MAAGFAVLAGATLGAGGTGAGLEAALARLGAGTGAALGAGGEIFSGGVVFLGGGAGFLGGGAGFLAGGDAFLGGADFTDADAVAFFLSTGAVRAAGGADLAGDRVTGFSSQRVATARARNERHVGTTTLPSTQIARRGGL
ncbi:MAG: hypothetical protein CFE40_12515 [Burkholderiales bacterium PBB1]|nr:MAG: hypothetical protein CFE40_12515 [Burkholderiales bacterium PBB1]